MSIDWIMVLHEASKRSGCSPRLSLHDLKTMADAVVAALEMERPRCVLGGELTALDRIRLEQAPPFGVVEHQPDDWTPEGPQE